MASIQKRQLQSGATVYIVKWRTPAGRHRSKGGFRTRKAAQAYATSTQAALLRGGDYKPKSGNTTFRVAAAAWLASRHDLKPTTRAEHAYALAPASTRRKPAQALSIDATFGGYPLNAIARQQISAWVAALTKAGKSPSTVRGQYSLVRMVLAQAVQDNKLPSNPADYVKLPPKAAAAVDDPTSYLTPQQVTAITQATPWPYNVMVHVAAWAGLRAAELAGLQIADVELPPLNLNGPTKPGQLHVTRTARPLGGVVTYLPTKTRGSTRTVPLTPDTTALLRGYLAEHPRAAEGTAPLFPGLSAVRAGVPTLDWLNPLRHGTFYQKVFKPACAVAGLAPVRFHALRHTYASLCVAAGLPALQISRFMGHTSVTITVGVYAHLFADDHADEMAALGAMAVPAADNVVPFRARR